MDFVVTVLLPLSLAIIMLSLGIGLTPADFARVAQRKRAFLIGAVFQILIVPVTAYLMILTFGLTGALAAGVMLLSFCPGGVTSNIVTRLALGDVALSVSLTAVISLLSIVTVPVLVSWAVVHFMGTDAPDITVTSLAIAMVLITTLPVAIGMIIRRVAPQIAHRIEPRLVAIASVLFVVIIVAAIVSNWGAFMSNIARLGPAIMSMLIILMLAGLAVTSLAGLTWGERKTISIEGGIQNGTLGVTLAPIIMGSASGIPEIGLPSAVYGVLMYVVAVPFVLWVRRK
ncbi:MAG: bile acid:sodium symporter family protein [Roseovarius sp.]